MREAAGSGCRIAHIGEAIAEQRRALDMLVHCRRGRHDVIDGHLHYMLEMGAIVSR
jgi:hypothetical protein